MSIVLSIALNYLFLDIYQWEFILGDINDLIVQSMIRDSANIFQEGRIITKH